MVAFPAAFAPLALPPTAPGLLLATATDSLSSPGVSLLQHTMREARLSWQFIKELFRYDP